MSGFLIGIAIGFIYGACFTVAFTLITGWLVDATEPPQRGDQYP